MNAWQKTALGVAALIGLLVMLFAIDDRAYSKGRDHSGALVDHLVRRVETLERQVAEKTQQRDRLEAELNAAKQDLAGRQPYPAAPPVGPPGVDAKEVSGGRASAAVVLRVGETRSLGPIFVGVSAIEFEGTKETLYRAHLKVGSHGEPTLAYGLGTNEAANHRAYEIRVIDVSLAAATILVTPRTEM